MPSRAWLLVALLLPYLAGWGLQTLIENPPANARARLGVVGFFGFGLTCAVASQIILADTEIKSTALIGLFALPLTAALIALVIFDVVERRWLLILFLALVAVDTLWIDRTLIEGRPRDEWLQEEPPDLIAHLAQTGGRIYTPDYAISHQDTAYWGIARFDGVDPFQMASFIDITETATGVPREGYSTTVPAVVVLDDDEDTYQYKDSPMDAELLGEWGVEWVITGYEIDIDGLTLVDELDGRYFYQNAFAWGDDLRLTWDGPNVYTISGDPSERQIHADVDGWSSDGDGERYTTPGLLPGAIITGLSVLLALGWLGWSRARV